MSEGSYVLDRQGGRALVRGVGDVDFSTRSQFEDVLTQAATSPSLVISFLDCTFCDSSIIGALVNLRESKPDRDVLLLVAPKTAVERVFGLVGIDRVFRIAPSEEGLAAGS